MEDGFYWVAFNDDEPAVCLVYKGDLYIPAGSSAVVPLDEVEDRGISICEKVER